MAAVAAGMARRGHAVAFAHDPRGPVGDRLDRSVARYPVRVRGDADPAAILALRRLVARTRADVVVVNTTRELRVGGLAARLAGRGAVVNRRGSSDALRNGLRDRLMASVLIDVLVRDSRFGVEAVRERNPWFRRPVLQARNGVDAAAVARTVPAARAAFGAGPGEFVVVLTDRRGRPPMAPQAAAAARRVVEAAPGPPVRIVIVGDVDPDVQAATHRAIGGACDVRATFLGPRTPDEALAVTAAADAMARPSGADGIPYAVLEAMALGVPVVASAEGGLPEAVDDGRTGFVIPTGDVAALAASLGRLRAEPALRAALGAAARERVRSEFSEARMLDEYKAAFRRAASGRAALRPPRVKRFSARESPR